MLKVEDKLIVINNDDWAVVIGEEYTILEITNNGSRILISLGEDHPNCFYTKENSHCFATLKQVRRMKLIKLNKIN